MHALGLCAVGEELKELAEKAAAGEQEGWEWVDEGKGNIHKWGFVSTQVRCGVGVGVGERCGGCGTRNFQCTGEVGLGWVLEKGG